MRTNDLALDYIDRAELTRDEARSAFKKKVYSLTIRRSQEIVELYLKSALRFLAIEYPETIKGLPGNTYRFLAVVSGAIPETC